MNITIRRFVAVLAALLTALLLTGCGCDHEWQRATCQAPRTCSRCGETEGKIRSHEWGNTACHMPEGCVVCGTVEGMELTHEWRDDCRICIHCGFDARPADDRFPEALAAGLEKRWQLEESLQAQEEYVFTGDDWAQLIAAEYDLLSSFREDTFEDPAVAEAAGKYISSIEASMAALEHFGTDQWEDAYYNGAYQEQTVALFLLNGLRPVEVSEAYGEKLENMLINGEIIHMVAPFFEQVQFLHINTTGAGKKFETTIKNTSSLTFEWFSFDVNLLDEDGKILTTETIKVLNWKPDEKRRFNFTTAENVAAIDVAFANWKLTRGIR